MASNAVAERASLRVGRPGTGPAERGKMATIDALLRVAEELELTSARIYDVLAEQLTARPKLSDLFRRLAEEERQHGMRVRLFARLSRRG